MAKAIFRFFSGATGADRPRPAVVLPAGPLELDPLLAVTFASETPPVRDVHLNIHRLATRGDGDGVSNRRTAVGTRQSGIVATVEGTVRALANVYEQWDETRE